ncbi:unnamed protein product [Polarella glacialis]|uniref:Uncharacterized protein n=1 Tax=Polarella glacialis TaxID=89957 RepID=A0A813FLW8_POLGL|nr:unnamed protein product [Polarella glacialis]
MSHLIRDCHIWALSRAVSGTAISGAPKTLWGWHVVRRKPQEYEPMTEDQVRLVCLLLAAMWLANPLLSILCYKLERRGCHWMPARVVRFVVGLLFGFGLRLLGSSLLPDSFLAAVQMLARTWLDQKSLYFSSFIRFVVAPAEMAQVFMIRTKQFAGLSEYILLISVLAPMFYVVISGSALYLLVSMAPLDPTWQRLTYQDCLIIFAVCSSMSSGGVREKLKDHRADRRIYVVTTVCTLLGRCACGFMVQGLNRRLPLNSTSDLWELLRMRTFLFAGLLVRGCLYGICTGSSFTLLLRALEPQKTLSPYMESALVGAAGSLCHLSGTALAQAGLLSEYVADTAHWLIVGWYGRRHMSQEAQELLEKVLGQLNLFLGNTCTMVAAFFFALVSEADTIGLGFLATGICFAATFAVVPPICLAGNLIRSNFRGCSKRGVFKAHEIALQAWCVVPRGGIWSFVILNVAILPNKHRLLDVIFMVMMLSQWIGSAGFHWVADRLQLEKDNAYWSERSAWHREVDQQDFGVPVKYARNPFALLHRHVLQPLLVGGRAG